MIAFDNRTGHCNTEEFETVEQAKEWLGYEDNGLHQKVWIG